MRRTLLTFSILALAGASAAAAAPQKAGTPSLPSTVAGPIRVQSVGGSTHTLFQLDFAAERAAASVLRAHGGVRISRGLALWRLSNRAAARLLPRFSRAGWLRLVEPDRLLEPLNHLGAGDWALAEQWNLAAIGADRAEPPGPGKPLVVIDDGVDLSHVEFAGRPNTVALNPQSTAAPHDSHGTAVASIAAAPANGEGLVGVYPQARLLAWDASNTERVPTSGVIAGLEAAMASGPAVINISSGSTSYDPAYEKAVFQAVGSGSVVVAASGNEGDVGNPLTFPANLNHVLTVAATNRLGAPTAFSSSSLGVDLAAPGERVPVAMPTWQFASGFAFANGTSFAAPQVAAGAAWVWTVRSDLDNTQVFDLMRWSARDVATPGFDNNTGFGILDIAKALSDEAPVSDHEEPNDDIEHVRAGGLFRQAARPLTAPGRPSATLTARLDVTEDPEDVYRIWVPAKREVRVRATMTGNVDLEIWRPGTKTVHARGAARRRDLVDWSYNRGTRADAVSVRNTGTKGAFLYLDVFLVKGGALTATYTLAIRTV